MVNRLDEWVAVTSPLLKLITAPSPRNKSDQDFVAAPKAEALLVSGLTLLPPGFKTMSADETICRFVSTSI